MRRSGITAPLRRPLFRRLATTYALNEMGDWMGIIALSVLVYEATESPLATAVLFLGTRFLPAFLAPLLVTRIERPPPRIALPLVYCGETAAFGALALLAPHFSLAAVVALATVARSAVLMLSFARSSKSLRSLSRTCASMNSRNGCVMFA